MTDEGYGEGVELMDLGEHRLKDLAEPEHVYQLVVAGLAADFPPPATLDRRPHNLPVQRDQLIGRDEELGAVIGLLVGWLAGSAAQD